MEVQRSKETHKTTMSLGNTVDKFLNQCQLVDTSTISVMNGYLDHTDSSSHQ
jgi:hypothetical protein